MCKPGSNFRRLLRLTSPVCCSTRGRLVRLVRIRSRKETLYGLAPTVNTRHCDILRLIAARLRKEQIDSDASGCAGVKMYRCQCGMRVNGKSVITAENAIVSRSMVTTGAHAIDDTVSDDVVKRDRKSTRLNSSHV